MRTYESKRGNKLVLVGEVFRPTLTVENYCKWYELHLVRPDGRVEEVSFEQLDDLANKLGLRGSAYVDHVPNPEVVQELADENEWDVDDVSMEVMVGRWQLEVQS